MSVRRKTPLVTLGFILSLGCAILGNRFTSVHRFTPFTTKRDDSRTMQSCVDSVNLLSRHIHADQETYGLRQWSLPLENGTIGVIVDFPGLDDNLIRASLEGRRILFMGDSTTKNLHNWLYTLLRIHHDFPNELSHLSTMNLSDANSLIASSGHGCAYKRRSGALTCTDWQSNQNERKDLGMIILHEEHSNYLDIAEVMKDHEPDVIVANIGLWLLHFQARSRDQEGCVVENWIHYEHWLENTLQMAEELGAKALFFKTTNTICSEKYTGTYSKANKLYTILDSDTMLDCFNNIKFTQKIHALPTSDSLSDDDIHNYCANATFNNRGSAHLNQRLYNFVESNQKTASLAPNFIFFTLV